MSNRSNQLAAATAAATTAAAATASAEEATAAVAAQSAPTATASAVIAAIAAAGAATSATSAGANPHGVLVGFHFAVAFGHIYDLLDRFANASHDLSGPLNWPARNDVDCDFLFFRNTSAFLANALHLLALVFANVDHDFASRWHTLANSAGAVSLFGAITAHVDRHLLGNALTSHDGSGDLLLFGHALASGPATASAGVNISDRNALDTANGFRDVLRNANPLGDSSHFLHRVRNAHVVGERNLFRDHLVLGASPLFLCHDRVANRVRKRHINRDHFVADNLALFRSRVLFHHRVLHGVLDSSLDHLGDFAFDDASLHDGSLARHNAIFVSWRARSGTTVGGHGATTTTSITAATTIRGRAATSTPASERLGGIGRQQEPRQEYPRDNKPPHDTILPGA